MVTLELDNINNRSRRDRIMDAMDLLNANENQPSVRFGINGFGEKWKAKQVFLSPKYTTDINDLFKVNS